MSVSSSSSGLYATTALCIVVAVCAVYGVKHRDEVQRIVADFSQSSIAKAAADGDSAIASEDTQTANREEPVARLDESGDVTLKAGSGGHFETSADVNGRSIDVLVDTGATAVALTYEDAERAGLFLSPSDFTARASTANGIAKIAPVTIESITIGSITVRNVNGNVAERGKLQRSLLGMSFLGRISRVDMRAKTLVLHE